MVMLAIALVFSSATVFAQQNDKENVEEEVIIIKEIKDEDGNVEVKKIIKSSDTEGVIIESIEGSDIKIHHDFDDLEDIHIIELKELDGLSEELQEKLKDVQIDIQRDQLNRKLKVIIDSEEEGGEPVIIEWEGEGDIPEDVKQKLEEHDVIIDGHGGFGHVPSHGIIKGMHPKNKACLGVMIGKTVENENGVETVTGVGEEGVAILDVFDGSGAAEAGLLKDDVITAINGEGVATIKEVLDVLKPYEGGATVSIDYLRNNQPAQTMATLKACKNKFKMKKFEKHGDADFEFDKDMNWVFEKEEAGEHHTKRTIVIKKNKNKITEEDVIAVSENEVAGIDTPDDVIFDSTNDLELVDFSLYPNPTEGNLNLSFTSEAVPTMVKIVDITGKEVYREELDDFNGTYQKEINLNSVPKGPLMLTIMQNDKVFADKVMVQ